jgi:BON domain
LGSELRDPYERDHLYARERARRDTEMIYYSPYGEPTPSGGFAGRGPKGYQRADDRIREDVCERLAEDPDIDASDMEVTVKDGEVTLSGSAAGRTGLVVATSLRLVSPR